MFAEQLRSAATDRTPRWNIQKRLIVGIGARLSDTIDESNKAWRHSTGEARVGDDCANSSPVPFAAAVTDGCGSRSVRPLCLGMLGDSRNGAGGGVSRSHSSNVYPSAPGQDEPRNLWRSGPVTPSLGPSRGRDGEHRPRPAWYCPTKTARQ